MSKEKYTVGFVSSPHPHSAYHVKTLDVLDDVDSVRLCGLEGENIETLALESSKISLKCNSVEDMLSSGGLDAILVSVRNDLCPAVLDAALNAEIPVLFEKKQNKL